MSTVVWIGNEVGIQKQSFQMEGVRAIVIDDDFSRYYTKYGFVYPISNHDPGFCAVIENRTPPLPFHIHEAMSNASWMMIDHHGSVWQIDYFMERMEENQVVRMSHFSIPAGEVGAVALCEKDCDNQILAGFLIGCKEKEKVSDFIVNKKVEKCKPLHWFTKEEIVNELHRRFPKEG